MNIPTLATLTLVLAYPILYAAYLSMHKVALAELRGLTINQVLGLTAESATDSAGTRLESNGGREPEASRVPAEAVADPAPTAEVVEQ